MEFDRQQKLMHHQQSILSKIALGDAISEILKTICLSIEELIDDKSAQCSILTLSRDQLFHTSAPSMDPTYCDIINGIKIGAEMGSCGTAAFRQSRVIVENIDTSPLWINFKHIAQQFNLQSCWSTPIISTQSTVLGTFAIYHDQPKSPSDDDLKLIDYFVHFSSIALEKNLDALKVKALIQDLKKSNEKLNAITKVMPDTALILNEHGMYVDVYGSSKDALNYSQNGIINKNVRDVFPADEAAPILQVIEQTLITNEIQVFEYTLETENGKGIFEGRTAPILNYQSDGSSEKHILWMRRDITLRKAAQKEAEKLAYYDQLTELPNRRLLTQQLSKCVSELNKSHEIGALLFLDIDNFKRINDSLGHTAGDKLLLEVTRRLQNILKNTDFIARIGGDEFVVLLDYVGANNETATHTVTDIAEQLQQVFNDNFTIGSLAFKVSGSIGICLIENVDATAENILKFADTAMYRTKMKGGNGYSFYDAALQTLLENQTELEADIIRAINHNEFCAYFQPQVDVSGQIIGGEALIRWHHPDKGLIPPDAFIPIAEQFGLIQQLQNIVLQDICTLLQQLERQNLIEDYFTLSINISQNQFISTTLKDELLTIINRYNIKPQRIKLEITESMLSHDLECTVQQMEELKEEGFTFSIDDFGTGYSCLSYLHAYPVKELKIDKSFIDNILNIGAGLSIVETIINLAKNLDILIVAEGVETSKQFDILKVKRVDAIQGYLIAKPMPIKDFIRWKKQYIIQNKQQDFQI